MSEKKRFEVGQDPRVQTEYFIIDTENKMPRNITDYPFDNEDVCSRIVRLLNEQQDTINNQEQKIRILQQEINDTQAILEMLTEKLRGWK